MDVDVSGDTLIACRHLCKDYSMGDASVHALRDVSFTVRRGEFIAVMGPSGSGKSTLMHLLGALDVPTSGELVINGQNITAMDADELAAFRNHYVGFVFQQFNLLPRTTALENVKLPLHYRHDIDFDIEERARQCLKHVGLEERMQHQPSQLSGGQQQRVAIARALVNSPGVILADEPTGALDTRTSNEILDLFRELNEAGITIIIVTHDPEVAEASKRHLLFRDGRLVDRLRAGAGGK